MSMRNCRILLLGKPTRFYRCKNRAKILATIRSSWQGTNLKAQGLFIKFNSAIPTPNQVRLKGNPKT